MHQVPAVRLQFRLLGEPGRGEGSVRAPRPSMRVGAASRVGACGQWGPEPRGRAISGPRACPRPGAAAAGLRARGRGVWDHPASRGGRGARGRGSRRPAPMSSSGRRPWVGGWSKGGASSVRVLGPSTPLLARRRAPAPPPFSRRRPGCLRPGVPRVEPAPLTQTGLRHGPAGDPGGLEGCGAAAALPLGGSRETGVPRGPGQPWAPTWGRGGPGTVVFGRRRGGPSPDLRFRAARGWPGSHFCSHFLLVRWGREWVGVARPSRGHGSPPHPWAVPGTPLARRGQDAWGGACAPRVDVGSHL